MQSRFKPIIESTVHKFKTTGITIPTLRATANANFFKALNTYDPSKNTEPITHIYNYMKPVGRVASESLMSGHIPEARNLKKATFHTTIINLQDRLGYEPSNDEIADELGWSKKETGRMMKELSGETTASSAEFDFYGNSKQQQSTDSILAEYLYNELDNKNKVIFEHTYGYNGKPVLSNTEIAKKVGVNNMAITRAQQKMGDRLASFR